MPTIQQIMSGAVGQPVGMQPTAAPTLNQLMAQQLQTQAAQPTAPPAGASPVVPQPGPAINPAARQQDRLMRQQARTPAMPAPAAQPPIMPQPPMQPPAPQGLVGGMADQLGGMVGATPTDIGNRVPRRTARPMTNNISPGRVRATQ